MKENPCVITTYDSIGNDWNQCQLLEMHKKYEIYQFNTVNVWQSGHS